MGWYGLVCYGMAWHTMAYHAMVWYICVVGRFGRLGCRPYIVLLPKCKFGGVFLAHGNLQCLLEPTHRSVGLSHGCVL